MALTLVTKSMQCPITNVIIHSSWLVAYSEEPGAVCAGANCGSEAERMQQFYSP